MQLFSNNATATLSAAITDVAVTLSVVTGKGALFASPTGGDYELATITDGTSIEIVKITARSADTFTIVRSQESTTALAWSAGATFEARATKGTLERLTQNLATGASSIALGSATASGSEGVAVGPSAAANGTRSVAIGSASSADNYGVAVGRSTIATPYSVSIGYATQVSQSQCVAIGDFVRANSPYAIAMGEQTKAGYADARASSTTYGVNAVVRNAANYIFVISSGSLTGSSEPSWNNTYGATTSDGGVTWLCIGYDTQASATYATAIGYFANGPAGKGISIGARAVSGNGAIAIGYNAIANLQSTVIGYGGYSKAKSCVVVGASSYVDTNTAGALTNPYHVVIGNNSHVQSGAGQSSVVVGSNCVIPGDSTYSVFIGDSIFPTAITSYSVAIGPGSGFDGAVTYSMAFGAFASNAVDKSHVMSGLSLVRNDAHVLSSYENLLGTGSQSIMASKVIDLTTLADDVVSITLPSGASFYVDEVGVIVTDADTVTGQPSISSGISGDTTAILASTPTTKSAAKGRDVFAATGRDGVATLTASVKAAATATSMHGRIYWKGILIEDE